MAVGVKRESLVAASDAVRIAGEVPRDMVRDRMVWLAMAGRRKESEGKRGKPRDSDRMKVSRKTLDTWSVYHRKVIEMLAVGRCQETDEARHYPS